MMRLGKSIREYKRQQTRPRNFKSIVVLFVGPAGTGKSTLAKMLASYLGSVYKAPQPKNSGAYYDDYDGQDVLFLDEFDGNRMKPADFNELCDRHEVVLPVHGGAGHQMISRFIFICSNYAPRFWWKNRKPSQVKQTTRRIDYVFKMFKEWIVPEVALCRAREARAAPVAPAEAASEPSPKKAKLISASSNLYSLDQFLDEIKTK